MAKFNYRFKIGHLFKDEFLEPYSQDIIPAGHRGVITFRWVDSLESSRRAFKVFIGEEPLPVLATLEASSLSVESMAVLEYVNGLVALLKAPLHEIIERIGYYRHEELIVAEWRIKNGR